MVEPADDARRTEQTFHESAGEYAEGPPGEELFGASRAWGGYASDQGEPGDVEELETPVAGAPADSETVKAQVCEQLRDEAALDVRDLAVDVVNGEVVLQGSTGSEDARRRAEVIARGTPGVRSVRNELEIRTGELEPPEERGRAA
jgi:hypothetical protein